MKKYAIVILVFVIAISIPLLMQKRLSHRHESADSGQLPSQPLAGMGENLAYSGNVVETMNSGGYTYVQVDTGDERIWAAGPETSIAVGDRVAFGTGMRMDDFRSETLDRTFETILFVPELRTGDATARLPAGHPPVSPTSGHPPVSPTGDMTITDFSGIEVPSGGQSIEDLYASKTKLIGQKVIVCGKVVKFTPKVMGKNWIHLRDGTGNEGENDLAVTTDAIVHPGDVVVVSGELGLDKDFGFGYVYDVIVENADVMVEQ